MSPSYPSLFPTNSVVFDLAKSDLLTLRDTQLKTALEIQAIATCQQANQQTVQSDCQQVDSHIRAQHLAALFFHTGDMITTLLEKTLGETPHDQWWLYEYKKNHMTCICETSNVLRTVECVS